MNKQSQKNFIGKILIAVCGTMIFGMSANAGELTYPDDSYASGDTLTASDLNAKFNGIKASVNDNNGKIDANTTAISDNASKISVGTAGAGSKAGDMQYWDGAAWQFISTRASDGSSNPPRLTLCDNVPTWTNADCIYAVGDTGPAGGIVFYVTDGGLHGLEAAPADLASAAWGCAGTDITTGSAIGTGAQNTADIVAACTDAGIAAKLASDYSLNGYSDWYLPSQDELNELYVARGAVGGFVTSGGTASLYLSSTQSGADNAISQFFSTGGTLTHPKTDVFNVRPIRSF